MRFLSIVLTLALAALAEQTAPIPAREAVSQFVVPDDVRVELVAAEPEVVDPVAVAFDERGRMYVVENRGYPTDDTGEGIVALLEDPDGDGYYDKRTVFADGFDFPNGVMPWKDGIILTCAPDLLYLKDNDGDGKADVREVLLTGFAPGGSTQLRVSHPTLGIDNWIYLTNGLSGGVITNPSHPEMAAVKMGSLDGRYNPLTGAFETTAGQAQFGQAFDDFGNKFVCSNRKHIEHVVLQPADLARNPHAGLSKTVAQIPDHGEAGRIFALSEARTTAYAHAGTFTAACGLSIYRGDALPAHYRGNAFVCDPTAALVHRDILEPRGATFIAKRGEENKDFFATPDNWSRPVFTANGPDGALFICDMYRKTIEHPVYLPEEIRGSTDFEGGKDCGRIYRVIGKNVKRTVRTLDPLKPETLVTGLGDTNGWVADSAQRLLLERGDRKEIHSALTAENPRARVKAMHLLCSFGALAPAEVALGTLDNNPRVREHALYIARTHYTDSAQLATPLVRDSDPRVRLAVALCLGIAPDEPQASYVMLPDIAIAGLDDEWTQYAVLSSLGEHIEAFSSSFVHSAPKDHPALPAFIETVARILATDIPSESKPGFLFSVLSHGADPKLWQIAAVRGYLEGLNNNPAFGDDPSPYAHVIREIAQENRSAITIPNLTAHTLRTVADPQQPLDVRIKSAQLLGYTDYDTAGAALGALIGPVAPPELQVAAVQSLAQLRDDRVAAFLASNAWGGFTAPVRTAATSALLATSQRTLALLDAIERGDVPAWTIDPSTRARLQEHREEAIKTKAQSVFANLTTTDRKKVYEEYKDALTLAANAASGAQVYKDLCSQCHLYNGVGHSVGPDLSSIRSQPNEAILMHVLMPNWLLEEGFESYTIETTDLETFSGIIKSQNESSVTIRCPLGIEKTIPRTEIVAIQTASKSLMPEELEKAMTKQQLRDLVGYLKGE